MLSFLSLLLIPAALAHNISSSALQNLKRGGKRFSNYNAEESQGACGSWNKNSEYVVALTAQQWDGGAHCFKDVYITSNGISAAAKIVDECMGCPWGGLDFSQGLFGHFVGGQQNNELVGIIYGDWSYGTGPSKDDDDDSTTTTKKAATTTKAAVTTTTSKATPTTTSSAVKTTTSTATSQSASASALAKSVSASAATTASASASSTPAGTQNMEDFSQALLNLAGLIAQAPLAA